MAKQTPPAPPPAVAVPAEVVETLVGYALRTDVGKVFWAGFLLGAGLPKDSGTVTVLGAEYRPKASEAVPPPERPA